MATRNADVSVPRGVWTQITNGSAIGDTTVILNDDFEVFLMGTSANSAPTGVQGGVLDWKGAGWSESTIAEKFPGIAAAITSAGTAYLWALSPNHDTTIFVSHG